MFTESLGLTREPLPLHQGVPLTFRPTPFLLHRLDTLDRRLGGAKFRTEFFKTRANSRGVSGGPWRVLFGTAPF